MSLPRYGVQRTRPGTTVLLLLALLLAAGCDAVTPDEDGYGENRNWAGNYLRVRLSPQQGPMLGEYSSRNAAVIAQHVAWAQEADLDFFAIPWRGADSWGHTTLTDHVVPNATFTADIGFCILYEIPTVLAGSPYASEVNLTLENRDQLIQDLLLLRDEFFGRPNYLRIDGDPVVVLRQSRRIVGDARIALNAVRLAYSDSTEGEGLYLVGDEVTWTAVALPNGSRISALDAITGLDLGNFGGHDGYPAGTGILTDLGTMWQQYALTAAGLDPPVPIFPSVMPGWNRRRLKPLEPVIPRSTSLGATSHTGTYDGFWSAAYDAVGTPAVVLLDSFNDWARDTQIEPIADNGDDNGTVIPSSLTGGARYYPYGLSFLEATSGNKGTMVLGAVYEVWYDDQPPVDAGDRDRR